MAIGLKVTVGTVSSPSADSIEIPLTIVASGVNAAKAPALIALGMGVAKLVNDLESKAGVFAEIGDAVALTTEAAAL